MARRKPCDKPDLFDPPAPAAEERAFEPTHSARVKKTAAETALASEVREALRREAELLKLTHPERSGWLSHMLNLLAQNDEPPPRTKRPVKKKGTTKRLTPDD